MMGHICAVDGLNDAEVCCTCNYPPTPLCKKCVKQHCEKQSTEMHFELPLEAINFIKDELTLNSYNVWLFQLRQQHKSLWKDFEKFCRREERIHAVCQEAIDCVNSIREDMLSKFTPAREAYRAEIERAIGEVQENMLNREWRWTTSLSSLIWACQPSLPSLWECSPAFKREVLIYSLQLNLDFHSIPELAKVNVPLNQSWEVYIEGLESQVAEQKATITDLKKRLAPQRVPEIDPFAESKSLRLDQVGCSLPCIITNCIGFFGFRSKKWAKSKSVKPKVKSSEWSSYVLIDSNRVFLCGGGDSYKAYRSAYFVEKEGPSHKLTKMTCNRSEHSAVLLNGSVHVFGGRCQTGPLREVESFDLESLNWTVQVPMNNSRYSFVAAALGNCIYLCGGNNQRGAIEVFHPEKRECVMLDATLPEYDRSLAFVLSDDLVVLTRKWITRFTVTEDGLCKVSSKEHSETNSIWSSTTPVVFKGHVYTVDNANCYWYNVETGERAEEEARMDNEHCALF